MRKRGLRLSVATTLMVALLSGMGANPAMAVQQVSSPVAAKPSPSPTPIKQSSAAAKAAAAKAAAAKAAAAKAAAAKAAAAKAAAAKAAAAKAAAAKAAAAKAAAAKAAAAKAKSKTSTPKPSSTPTPTSTQAPALALPAFTLSSTAETVQATKSLVGFTATSTGGAIASFSISPAAPAGTTFSTSTGALSGTPTTAFTSTVFTVTATNATGSATASFNLTVSPALLAPAFTLSRSTESVQATTALSGFTVNSTGGAIASFSISPTPPAGTTFNTTTGALSGTPTTALTSTVFTITATNATGSSTATYNLTVTPALLAPAFSLSRISVNGEVNRPITGFTVTSTGGAIASFSISPTPPAGITFNTTTGALSGTPTATSPNILYAITATNASGSTTAGFIMDVRPGLQGPAFTLSRSSESVQVSTAIQGFTINSTGGEISSFSISPISPPGTVFNPFTGALTGTPTSVQTATTYTITATNAEGSATATYSLGVTAPLLAAPLFSLSRSSESIQLGSALAGFTINSIGGAISSFSISPAAPAGTTFNTTTGQLTGTPTSPLAATDFVITATNSTGSAPRLFNLTVLALPRLAVTKAPSGPVTGQAFRVQPQITIQDAQGVDLTTSGVVVTASVSAGGTLIGTVTATTVNGVATFTSLGLDGTIGSTYTVTFSAPGHTSSSKAVANREWIVGDTGPGGGIIFYANYSGFACGLWLDETCRYLESAPTTGPLAWVDSPGRWSSVTLDGGISLRAGDRDIPAGGTQIGRGASNSVTFTILNDYDTPENYETVITRYRGPNNIVGWHLPSLDELSELHKQRAIVGGFGALFYWSSSWEDGTNQAWYLTDLGVSAFAGKMALDDPTKIAAFRAIRSF